MKAFSPLNPKFVSNILGLFLALQVGAAPVVLHVATTGNDHWSGALDKPNNARSDGPMATLSAALKAARAAKEKGQAASGVTILMHGGRYELTEAITLTPEDSGTSAQAPLVIAAAPGDMPILSGGRQITSWRQTGKEWISDLPEVKAGRWSFRQLAANGTPRSRPRLPKQGDYTIAGLAGADAGGKYNTPGNRFEFKPGEINPQWRNANDIEVVVLHFWVDAHLRIASISNNVVTFDRQTRRKLTEAHGPKPAPYYVDNVFEALSQPGEFYLDRAAGQIHYLPMPGESPATTTIVAGKLPMLVEMMGDAATGKLVKHIQFRGLSFSDTTWDLPGKDAGDLQAANTVPGAVIASGTRDCALEDCHFINLGTYAIELRDGCQANRFVGNEFAHLGGGGFKVNGGTAKSPEALRTGGMLISDNHLYDLGRIFHSAVGILLMHSGGNTVTHNHIHDLYYTGISAGWVWGYSPSVSSNNVIAYNHIHHVGRGLLSDMGGVYLLGIAPGTVIANNLIHDVDARAYGGWGLYTDEGSTGVVLENNIVYRCKNAGFHQHYGRENVIRNNIFALNLENEVMRTREEPHISFFFTNNVVYFNSGNLLGSNWKSDRYVMERNVYFDPRPGASANSIKFSGAIWDQWKARGHDTNSLFADPLFEAPQRDDFKLKADSPAFALGFKAIDLTTVGIRPKEKRGRD